MPLILQPTGTLLSIKDRHLKFIAELLKYSNGKDDPISEWEYTGETRELGKEELKDGFKCICTTPISILYRIRNKVNSIQLEIGSECIKRWLNPRISCDDCKATLGNITKRMRSKDYLCRLCKKNNIAKQTENNIRKKSWSECYINNKLFSDITDISYIEEIINKDNKSNIEESFERYNECCGSFKIVILSQN